MIIFYNKKTGDVIGTVDGRVHDEKVLKGSWTQPGNIAKEDIGKYVVPFVPIYEEVEEVVEKRTLVDKKNQLYKIEHVKQKVKKVKGLKPGVPFAKKILEFEKSGSELYKYKIRLDKDKKVVGFIKKG